MNLSRSIFEEVNKTTQEDKVNKVLNFLIYDEEEAIEGYTKSINDLGKILTDEEKIKLVNECFSHIIDEEKEHIEEIKSLAKDLGITITE